MSNELWILTFGFYFFMSSMYREQIMDHYKHPRNFGELPGADVVLDIDNPLCGDKLKLQIKFKNPLLFEEGEGGGVEDYVQDVKFSGQGCAISVASASLFTEYLKNKTRAELLALDEEIIYKLLGVEINAGRAKCALLPLAALHKVCAPAFTKEGVRGRSKK
ncbi:MAG: iron-sulfur cluster assembly scaffold protein [Patescibacteria group bacterium]